MRNNELLKTILNLFDEFELTAFSSGYNNSSVIIKPYSYFVKNDLKLYVYLLYPDISFHLYSKDFICLYTSPQYNNNEQLIDELIIFKELILPKYLK